MHPRPRDPLALATEQLMRALADARERDMGPPLPAATPMTEGEFRLMTAIQEGDIPGIAKAASEGADVNFSRGRPLQLAAARNNEKAMAELVILGAEVSIAAGGLQEKLKALAPRKGALQLHARDPEVRAALQALMDAMAPPGSRRYRINDRDIEQLLSELDRQGSGMLSSPDAVKYERTQQVLATLQAWEKKFIQSIAPVEILRGQRKIMEAIAEIKAELTGRKLDKPKLSAPKKLRDSGPGAGL